MITKLVYCILYYIPVRTLDNQSRINSLYKAIVFFKEIFLNMYGSSTCDKWISERADGRMCKIPIITVSISLLYWFFRKTEAVEVFCKKGVLRNFAKLTGKHLYQSLFFNEVTGLWHRRFPVNFAKFLRTPFLQDTSGRLSHPIGNFLLQILRKLNVPLIEQKPKF